MTSILTNTGSMVALQSLQATQKSLNETQNRISTGLKVQTAKDGAASWAIATTMKANISSLGQVATNLGNADSILGTAAAGANQIAGLISKIRDKVVSATDPSTDTASTQNEVDQLMKQIDATIKSSSFNGVNLLDGSVSSKLTSGGTNTGLTFLAATANDYASGTSSTIQVDTTNTNLKTSGGAASMATLSNYVSSTGTAGSASGGGTATGLADIKVALAADPTKMDTILQKIDAAAGTVKAAAAQFGAVQQNVQAQQTFVKNLSDTLTAGVSNLVDADMTTESARLSALQTQQQLGTQALSIANQAPQMILKLFG